ncbi:hypothetical protein WICPIJ_000590 [Wickerhamomyces pijperi]|uniref:Meiotically up-regulated protein Msb1/Mug8 domain-containing protein n=1 Tax=Wickerhamomyces pijperi TaxID=599730 RepID=A0A9P8QDI2_WICPI|nr:hypothetical protein WICPIJ_000590 [Wickerhamomyces pijperi]
MRSEPAYNPNMHLETTAEKFIGKEINVVDKQDFNHLDLIIEAKNNRLKAEFFYIYDFEKFNNCSLLRSDFDIFNTVDTIEGSTTGLTHTSTRYVVHYLTKALKKRFEMIIQQNKDHSSSKASKLFDVFKPSLGQFDNNDIVRANEFIKKMFPYEGCSYTGDKLESIIREGDWMTLVLSLRIIWSLLPGAIIPWESFESFNQYEKSTGFTDMNSFYSKLPLYLPSHNHSCVLFEFLEIFIKIFENNFFIDLDTAIDLIFTAGQICFNRDIFQSRTSNRDDDLHELQKFYYKRGYSFHQIFISYLRSLSTESAVRFKQLFDLFKINQYPPAHYQPLSQKALSLTVPHDPELNETNYFKLISMATNATSRIYSSNHSFTKFENKFLDKFEVNPYKIIDHFFSKSSKNYLHKFDPNLNFEDFKIENQQFADLRKNLKEGTTSFENTEFISTFMKDFQKNGFGKSNSETFMADTINFNFSSSLETLDDLPVRVSKLDISEWFINSWKYETFLGYLQNTVVLKLTKTIGDCDWLIISSNEKISTKNRYLTPPSSAIEETDNSKYTEMQATDIAGTMAANKRAKRSPSKKKQLEKNKNRISCPSAPQNIGVFDRQVLPTSEFRGSNDFNAIYNKTSPPRYKRKSSCAMDKELPPPKFELPNESAVFTPPQQVVETFSEPPALVREELNNTSLPPNVTGIVYHSTESVESISTIKSSTATGQGPSGMTTPPKKSSSDGAKSLQTPPSSKEGSPFAQSAIVVKYDNSPAGSESPKVAHHYAQLKSSPPRMNLKKDLYSSDEVITPDIPSVITFPEFSPQRISRSTPPKLSLPSKSDSTSTEVNQQQQQQQPARGSVSRPSFRPSFSHNSTPLSPVVEQQSVQSPTSSVYANTPTLQSRSSFSARVSKSPLTSPIVSAFPKFFKKPSSSFSKGSNHHHRVMSDDSLRFINDSSELPPLQSKPSSPQSAEYTPQMPRTPDGISPSLNGSNRSSAISALTHGRKSSNESGNASVSSTNDMNDVESAFETLSLVNGHGKSSSIGSQKSHKSQDSQKSYKGGKSDDYGIDSLEKANINLQGLLDEIKLSIEENIHQAHVRSR